MVKKKQYAKKSGFSYIELILSIFIIANIFVISQQIIYNIINSKNVVETDKTISIEIFALRIESHFKEVEEFEIGEDYLRYYYRNKEYLYQVIDKSLTYKFNNKIYVILENIKMIHFKKEGYFLYITIINLVDFPYHVRIIIYD